MKTTRQNDGNGLRVAKKSGAASDCSGGTVTKLYWRSISGDALAETDGTGSVTNAAYNEYVFFAGRRIASRSGTGVIFYFFADQLGTTRTITTGNGPGQTSGQLCYDADFTPYGTEISHSERLQTTACPPNYRFTGYEYDSETGLNYVFARYYSPRLGRFLSTDPLGGGIGDLQSHNAYSYVANNPANFLDPSGMYQCNGTMPNADGYCPSAGFPNGAAGMYASMLLFGGPVTVWVSDGGHWEETPLNSIFLGEPFWVEDGHYETQWSFGSFSFGGIGGGAGPSPKLFLQAQWDCQGAVREIHYDSKARIRRDCD